MKALEPLILTSGAILIALVSSGITAAWYRARLRRIETDTWKQADIYHTRKQNPDAIRI